MHYTITNPNPTVDGFFGFSVAVRVNILVVEAQGEVAKGLNGAGHAYIMSPM